MKQTLITILVQVVLPLAASGAFAAAIWALTKLSTVLKTKADGNKLVACLATLTVHADTVVSNIQATLIPVIKKDAADGALSATEVAQLRTAALAKLKESLGTEGVAAIQDVVGILAPSLDSFLSGFIETRVAALGPKTALSK